MKLKKSHLKELVREELFKKLSEDNGQQPPAKKDSEETEKKLKIDIPDNPFDVEKKLKVKELLRKRIKELKFKDSKAFKKYKSKHKMRKSTKVNVAGKDTTAGEVGGKKSSKDWEKHAMDAADAANAKMDKDAGFDVGGPAHANVPKGAKSSKQAKAMMKKKPKDIKDMSSTERGKYFSTQTTDISTVKGPKPGGDWTVKSVQNAEIDGATVGDILGSGFNHKDYKKAYDYAQKFQGDPPSKKKAAKKSKFDPEKQIKSKMPHKQKSEGGPGSGPQPDGKSKADSGGKKKSKPDQGDDFEHDRMSGDDSWMKKALAKKKSKAIDSLNKQAKQGKQQLIDTERYGMVSWEDGDPNEDTFFATGEDGESIELDYDEIVRFHNPDEVDVRGLTGEGI